MTEKSKIKLLSGLLSDVGPVSSSRERLEGCILQRGKMSCPHMVYEGREKGRSLAMESLCKGT